MLNRLVSAFLPLFNVSWSPYYNFHLLMLKFVHAYHRCEFSRNRKVEVELFPTKRLGRRLRRVSGSTKDLVIWARKCVLMLIIGEGVTTFAQMFYKLCLNDEAVRGI